MTTTLSFLTPVPSYPHSKGLWYKGTVWTSELSNSFWLWNTYTLITLSKAILIQRLIEVKGLIYGTRRSLSGVYCNHFLSPHAGCTATRNMIHQEQPPVVVTQQHFVRSNQQLFCLNCHCMSPPCLSSIYFWKPL